MGLPEDPAAPEAMVANPQRAELGPWIDAVLREIDAKLRSMPEKVTSTQARADHNDLAHRGY
ncbi:MAG: hypothetical protein QOF10_3466 [Kribbellaceae bacterium]|nr:hypothetical protein [Kribbellaceae bacterium]